MTNTKCLRVSLLCSAMALALEARGQSLPEGLTCGLSYLADDRLAEDNACNGISTIRRSQGYAECDSTDAICSNCLCVSACTQVGCFPGYASCCQVLVALYNPKAAPGYTAVGDGDWGALSGRGFYHQRLSSGVTDPSLASSFVLPSGEIC